jgi:repressor LexA
MPENAELTERQQEIYDFIREFKEDHGFPPTVRDIGKRFRIKSPNGVMCHLKALQKKGAIERGNGQARAIVLMDEETRSPGLPLLGAVAAGNPIQAVEQADWLEFDQLFGGKDLYALKVKGLSMIDDQIRDGDYVVIRKQETAHNGERVVAMVDGEATLKKFYKERGRIRLEPANGNFAPIYASPEDNVHVLGLLVGVMRKC